MFVHYLKIAFRNLLKYKTQTIISIVGLAIGFTAFTLSTSWIRYEMSFDNFNPHSENIYKIINKNVNATQSDIFTSMVPYQMKKYLEDKFPEIQSVTAISPYHGIERRFFVNENEREIYPKGWHFIHGDTSFFSVFYPELQVDFSKIHFQTHTPTIFTNQTAQLLSKANKDIQNYIDTTMSVFATVPETPINSNVYFDIFQLNKEMMKAEELVWMPFSEIFIRVHPSTDITKLEGKLKIPKEITKAGEQEFIIVPLRKLHFLFSTNRDSVIKINHLKIFSLVSLMIIFCALFNYFTLFINRIKIRTRELSLRKINGASNSTLLILLVVEFMLILLLSLFLGAVFVEILFPEFIKFSAINIYKYFLFKELILYASVFIVMAILFIAIPTYLFMKRTIYENIHSGTQENSISGNGFSMISIAAQLIISILLMFCGIIIYYQNWSINNSNLGFEKHNIVYIGSDNPFKEIPINEFNNIPFVKEAIYSYSALLPPSNVWSSSVLNDKRVKSNFKGYDVIPGFFNFFNIDILEGRVMRDNETNVCLINETAKRMLNYANPIGEKIGHLEIIGIISDLYNESPLTPVSPAYYYSSEKDNTSMRPGILLKYTEGKYKEIMRAVEEIGRKLDMFISGYSVEEEYKNYTKSERYLFILLGIMTAVAILIAVFGIYSMITLACSQRRKEIAIRKVNGAKVKEILALFFRQYFAVTVAACMVAFPVGVYVMQRWLEQYTRRVSMEWWLFAGVFVLVAAIVFASIIFRVWKAANENPAEVVKSE